MNTEFDTYNVVQARIRNIILGNMSITSRPTLKRNVGYGEEEVSATRTKMSKMEIDRDSEGPSHKEINGENGVGAGVDHWSDIKLYCRKKK